MNRTKKQNGTSLVETMVAVVVLSLGMIGIASTMLTSMRNNDATMSRTQSTMLANEIYEKMLVNLPAAKAGSYNLSIGAIMPKTTNLECEGSAANCSGAQMATWDLAKWGYRADKIMPRADASININTTPDPMVVTIEMRFTPLRETTGYINETFTFLVR